MKEKYLLILLSGASVSLVMNAANMLFQLVITILLANLLPTRIFGLYVLYMASISIISVFASFGLPTFIVREVASNVGAAGLSRSVGLLKFAVISTWFLIGLTVVLVCPIVFHMIPEMTLSIVVFATLFLVGKVFTELFSSALLGFGKVYSGQLIQLVLPNAFFVLFLAVAALVVQDSISLPKVFIAQAVGQSIATIAGCRFLAPLVWKKSGLSLIEIPWRKWLSASAPLFLINGLAAMQQNIMFIVLGTIMSIDTIALFRVAERISAFAQFLRRGIDRVLAPRVAKYWAGEKLGHIKSMMRKACLGEVAFCNLFLITCFFVGKPAIGYAFGDEYMGAWIPLLVLASGFALASIFGFSGTLLTMTSNAPVVFRVLLFSVTFQIVLAYLLASNLGVVGVAIAAGSACVLTQLMLWLYSRRLTGVDCSLLGLLGSSVMR